MELGEIGIILLFVGGMALIIAEAFLPGVILGVIGIAMVLASIFFAFAGEMVVLGWLSWASCRCPCLSLSASKR